MKFLCECGATVYDQTDYLPNKAYLFKDEDWDRLWSRHMPRAYECLVCGRLLIERRVDAPAEPLVSFRPESGRPEHVLRSQFGPPG